MEYFNKDVAVNLLSLADYVAIFVSLCPIPD